MKINFKQLFSQPFALVLISLAFYFAFGFSHLGQFHTADEHYWMSDPACGRIFQYWNAIANEKWEKTMINDKPGVTLAYVSGAGLLFDNTLANILSAAPKCNDQVDASKTVASALAFRIPLLLFNGLFIFYFYWILKRLFKNSWVAAWSSSLILLSPAILGISQIVNPDSLLWVFSGAAIFTYLTYLKELKNKDGLLTALLMGLALLTKYTSVIVLAYLPLMLVVHLLFEKIEGKELAGFIKRNTYAYFSIAFGAILLFVALMPAIFVKQKVKAGEGLFGLEGLDLLGAAIAIFFAVIWVDAKFFQSRFLQKVLNWFSPKKWLAIKTVYVLFLASVVFVLVFWMLKNESLPLVIFDVVKVPFDEGLGIAFKSKPLIAKPFMELFSLVFSLQPFVLVAFGYTLLKTLWKKNEFDKLVFSLFGFIVVFYAAVISQGLMVDVRYAIVLYPLVMVIAALGIFDLVNVGRKFKNMAWIGLFLVLFATASLWSVKPFYFNYASPLLPQDRLVAGAWGYGGYEAAQYLNGLPGAQNLTVWSDYNGFCQFFVGNCVKGNKELKSWTKEGKTVDYYVKTRRGSIMYEDVWQTLGNFQVDLYDEPIWQLFIDNRPGNYIKIFKSLK
jgi:4-amino-4-deoxy-L-arabinose transferase-like glycosyltransferase